MDPGTADARASVLIVDDTPANLLVLEAVLAPLGPRIVRANTGAEAVALVKTEVFAVALVDVQMPEMDGFETAAAIRATDNGRELPIVFLTAIHRDSDYVRRGYQAGAADYITKPFDPEILRARVRAFVDLYSQREQVRIADIAVQTRARDDAMRRLRGVLLDSPTLLASMRGPDHRCDFANPAFRAMTGVALEGKPFATVGVRAELGPLLSAAYHSGARVHVDELKTTRDGVRDARFFQVSIQPQRTADGDIEGLLVYLIDITAHVEARSALEALEKERVRLLDNERTARRDAEIANLAKDEFLATISHELRTPLNAILGWSRMARTAPDRIDHALTVIERNAAVQARIIEDVLDVSRIMSGRLKLDIDEVNLDGTIRGALDAVKPAAVAKNVQLAVDIGEIGVLFGDADRLQQIVWNLLTNAIKFTPKGGRIELSATRNTDDVVVRVRDTGQGIERSFLPHVFDPFRQADGSTTRRHGGVGLGLAIVKQLVQAHGGTIRAESDGVGLGATFVATLPVAANAEESARERPQKHATATSGDFSTRLDGLTVLVVDDEEDARDLLVQALGDRGAAVATAGSVAEALGELARCRPHVVVSDIAMPDADGYALVQRMRALSTESGGATPAIALTAYARAEDAASALRAGFQMHLPKPVDLERLVLGIANLGGVPHAATG
jgi:signal transduction histidine kinase